MALNKISSKMKLYINYFTWYFLFVEKIWGLLFKIYTYIYTFIPTFHSSKPFQVLSRNPSNLWPLFVLYVCVCACIHMCNNSKDLLSHLVPLVCIFFQCYPPVIGKPTGGRVSITAWIERYCGSQEPKNTTKSYSTTNLTQEVYWEEKSWGKKQQRTEQKARLI